jgi:hypothetical protein
MTGQNFFRRVASTAERIGIATRKPNCESRTTSRSVAEKKDIVES